MTPRSMTSKLLHCSTTPTIFLPMSCTSPLTVAMMMRPLERCAPASLLCSMNGTRCATARFITRALLTTCGRNILPLPNRSPTTFMPSMSGPSMTCSGLDRQPCLFRVRDDVVVDALDEGVFEAFGHRQLAPLQILLAARAALALEARRDLQQPLGGIGAPVENHVLARRPQLRLDLLVDAQLSGIHDPHVHASGNGVVEEHRVHRLAHCVVAAERERHVAHPAAHQRVRQLALDAARSLDKRHAVAVVFLDRK